MIVCKIKFQVSEGNRMPLMKVLRTRKWFWKAWESPQSSFAKSHRSGRSEEVPVPEQGDFVIRDIFCNLNKQPVNVKEKKKTKGKKKKEREREKKWVLKDNCLTLISNKGRQTWWQAGVS